MGEQVAPETTAAADRVAAMVGEMPCTDPRSQGWNGTSTIGLEVRAG